MATLESACYTKVVAAGIVCDTLIYIDRAVLSSNQERRMAAELTTRSRVAVRTTTCPADMGYGGRPTGWKTASPDIVTSPAKALEYVRGLRSRFGGADYALHITHAGREISLDDITAVVTLAELRDDR